MTQQLPTEEEVKAILVKQLESGEITREQAAQKMSNYRKMASGQQVTQTVGTQQQAPVEQQPDPSIGSKVLGDVQAIGRVVGGMVAEPLAGMAGMAVGAITGDSGQAAEAVEAVQRFPEVIPLNETGQKRMGQLGTVADVAVQSVRFPVSGLAGIVAGALPGGMTGAEAVKAVQEEGVADTLGDSVMNITGSPELAAAAYTLPTAALEAMGIKGARKLKGQTFAGAESTILSTNTGKALQQATPSVKALKDKARTLYKAVDESGATINQEDYMAFALDLNDKLRKSGFNSKVADKLSPKALAVLQAIEDGVGEAYTFSDFDDIRKLTNAGTLDINNKLEQSLAQVIKSEMDDFIDAQALKLSGESAEVGNDLTKARELWQRAKKAETIDELIVNASHAKSGFENGLRDQFKSLLTTKQGKKKLKGFSESEIALMKEIQQGTGIANTLRRAGKLGIGEGQQTNMLLGTLAGAGGYAAGGPFGAITIPALGTVSGNLAKRLTANKSQMLSDITKAGQNGQQVVSAYMKNTPKAQRNVTELTELLLQSNADLSKIKSGPVDRLVQDAAFAAEHLSNVGLANFLEAPAFLAAIQDEE